jgi:hypothetical protein
MDSVGSKVTFSPGKFRFRCRSDTLEVMTLLGLAITVTLVAGFAGMGVLSLLGASLRTQGAGTTRQLLNRRMLALGGTLCGTATILPFLALGWRWALFFAIGWVALGILVAAMFASRAPTRLLATLLFLSAALLAVVSLPPHMGTFNAVGVFVVGGLVLAKLTRMATIRIAHEGPAY